MTGSTRRGPFVVEAMWIAGVTVALCLAWLMVLHAALGWLGGLDARLQMSVHRLASMPLTGVMLAFTWMGAIKIMAPAVVLVVSWLVWERRRHTAAVLGLSMLGALLLNYTLKLVFHRARPVLAWSLGDEHTYSFPSGHALFATTLYGVLAYLAMRPRVSVGRRVAVLVPAILLPVAIGLSRIYFGEHFPTDVLAGYGVGLIWLAGVVKIDGRWQVRPARAAGVCTPF